MRNNKLIVCKTCGAEIAASAKSCPHCGAKNNANIPVWARLLIGVIVIVTLFSVMNVISGEPDSNKSDKNSVDESTQADNQNADIVLLDDDNIKVTYKGVSENIGIEACNLELKIENKTDCEVWVYLDKASVNDEMIPLVMSGVPTYIQPGKSSSNPSILSYSTLSINSVDEINTISFVIGVQNNETQEVIETTDFITININND